MVSDKMQMEWSLELEKQDRCTCYMAMPFQSRRMSPGGHQVSPDRQYLQSSNHRLYRLRSLSIVREEEHGSGLKVFSE